MGRQRWLWLAGSFACALLVVAQSARAATPKEITVHAVNKIVDQGTTKYVSLVFSLSDHGQPMRPSYINPAGINLKSIGLDYLGGPGFVAFCSSTLPVTETGAPSVYGMCLVPSAGPWVKGMYTFHIRINDPNTGYVGDALVSVEAK